MRFITQGILNALLIGSFLLLMLALSKDAAASTPTPIYECNGCTTGAMGNVARSIVASKYPTPRPGDGAHATVYNLSSNSILTFWVGWYATNNPDGRPYQWYVTSSDTSSNLSAAFAKWRNIYVQNGGSLILTLPVSSAASLSGSAYQKNSSQASSENDGCWEARGLDNAYDAAIVSAVRNDLILDLTQHIQNSTIWGEYIWDLLQVARFVKSPFLSGFDMPLVFDHKFVDGGRIAFRYNWDTSRIEHISKTIQDCEKNTVPETKPEFNGAQFRIKTEYNLENFKRYVERLNGGLGGSITVTGGGPWICSGGADGQRAWASCRQMN